MIDVSDYTEVSQVVHLNKITIDYADSWRSAQ